MNTTPDEVLLALWLDDELEGEELARVESWAMTQPDQLAAREEVRAWRKTISATIPSEVEPPYPDFFNSRIEKSIRGLSGEETPTAPVRQGGSFWRWLFPASAFAGMALAFWVGTKASAPSGAAPIVKLDDKMAAPAWYSPEQGVNAEWVNGRGAGGGVIVLQGVSAIPDALDFSETALFQSHSDSSSTAGAIEVKTSR